MIIAQDEDSTSVISDQLIENVVSEPVTNNEELNVIDYLEDLKKEPININNADLTELQKIPELDINYAALIIKHREKYGHFFSTGELYSIKDLPKYIVNDIKPFITIGDTKSKDIETKDANYSIPDFTDINFRSRLSYSLNDNSQSYKDFAGSRLKLYNRLNIRNGLGEAGILTEKDAGERSYYDFISFHLQLKNIWDRGNIVLGDYSFEFGQGLVLWGPVGFSKATDAIFPTKVRESKILPYNSTDENRFFRGIATSLKYNGFNFSFFYSNHRLDASIDTGSGAISSLITTGYHRTKSELKDRNLTREMILGGSVHYRINDICHLGILYFSSNYDRPFRGSLINTPKGSKFQYLSTSYESNIIPSIYISGEIAYDFNSIASLNTFQISFDKNFLFVSSIRNYPSNFISLHGNSLAEQRSKVQNEIGYYNGFKLLTRYGTLNFYYDQFKFPLGGYRFPISNAGEEFLVSYSNTIKEDINIKLNYKYEDKDYLVDQEDQRSIVRRGRNDVRLLLSWNLLKEVSIKCLAEYNGIRIKEVNRIEEGVLLGNSLILNLINNLKFTGTVCFFRTDSYFSSVYEYDGSIRGLVRGEVLYGEGVKLSYYINYKLIGGVNFSLQYSEIIKPKEQLINPLYSNLTDNFTCQVEIIL
ncbi:MAG: helix-hairpin-helix domain-containing protein [Ignavibacteriaceae bacterium]|nr:helix-hairpin-helix domain-containing protein [Ignavibacteriaceae bacterium]